MVSGIDGTTSASSTERSSRDPSDDRAHLSANGIAGRHVLWGLIGFFGVIFAVNAIFVYAAEETFSGGDTSDPYRKGLDYNASARAAERQAERGWQTDIAAMTAKTGGSR